MISNATYLEEINTYKKLKQSLNSTAKALINSASSVDNLDSTIKNEYTVDNDSTNLSNRCKNLKKKMAENSSYILNTIIPAIDREIKNLEKQMAANSATNNNGSGDLSSVIVKGIINRLLK